MEFYCFSYKMPKMRHSVLAPIMADHRQGKAQPAILDYWRQILLPQITSLPTGTTPPPPMKILIPADGISLHQRSSASLSTAGGHLICPPQPIYTPSKSKAACDNNDTR